MLSWFQNTILIYVVETVCYNHKFIIHCSLCELFTKWTRQKKNTKKTNKCSRFRFTKTVKRQNTISFNMWNSNFVFILFSVCFHVSHFGLLCAFCTLKINSIQTNSIWCLRCNKYWDKKARRTTWQNDMKSHCQCITGSEKIEVKKNGRIFFSFCDSIRLKIAFRNKSNSVEQ